MLATSKKVEKARLFVMRSVSLLAQFKLEHGQFPCHLSDVLGKDAELLEELGKYQASSSGYFILVRNPGGTNVILFSPLHSEQRAIEWQACTAAGSCPPGDFAFYCCDQVGYPSCDSYKQ